jgi:hypothetical protein
MKKILFLILTITTLITFNSCIEEDNIEFIAQPPSEFGFTNSFLSEYTLIPAAANNVGERFVWNKPDFGTPTNISYDLQSSTTADFATFDVVGTTNDTEMVVTIGQMLAIANEAGLDNDPNTPEPNEGAVYFRLRAYVGSGTGNTEAFTNAQQLNVVLPEAVVGSGVDVSTWGVVGSGYNNWGAFEDAPFYTTDQANVLVAYVTLVDGEIKFRENNDWGNNFGDDGVDGTLDPGGANIAVSAGTYKIVLDLNNNTYTIEAYSWGIVGSAYNDWGNAGPDAKFYYDYSTDTFKVGVKLLDGEFKIRLNNDWGTNYGDTGADGTLDAGGDNIVATAGYYTVTIDLNSNTYTVEAANLWGIVGSGYNDWGNAGPDYLLTEVNPGIWVGEIVTLLDGEIKFRVNEDWGNNLGDDGIDGTLEAGGANIPSTAGSYRIRLDLNDNTYQLNQL